MEVLFRILAVLLLLLALVAAIWVGIRRSLAERNRLREATAEAARQREILELQKLLRATIEQAEANPSGELLQELAKYYVSIHRLDPKHKHFERYQKALDACLTASTYDSLAQVINKAYCAVNAAAEPVARIVTMLELAQVMRNIDRAGTEKAIMDRLYELIGHDPDSLLDALRKSAQDAFDELIAKGTHADFEQACQMVDGELANTMAMHSVKVRRPDNWNDLLVQFMLDPEYPLFLRQEGHDDLNGLPPRVLTLYVAEVIRSHNIVEIKRLWAWMNHHSLTDYGDQHMYWALGQKVAAYNMLRPLAPKSEAS